MALIGKNKCSPFPKDTEICCMRDFLKYQGTFEVEAYFSLSHQLHLVLRKCRYESEDLFILI